MCPDSWKVLRSNLTMIFSKEKGSRGGGSQKRFREGPWKVLRRQKSARGIHHVIRTCLARRSPQTISALMQKTSWIHTVKWGSSAQAGDQDGLSTLIGGYFLQSFSSWHGKRILPQTARSWGVVSFREEPRISEEKIPTQSFCAENIFRDLASKHKKIRKYLKQFGHQMMCWRAGSAPRSRRRFCQ